MQNDPYSPCPCGSGKKFKWCCQPIHESLAQVYTLEGEGQHDAALRAMDAVVAEHPTNPEAFGRKALMQFNQQQHEEAEKTLDKAFELSPTYPFGYFLKAQFRQAEGELPGALLLYRKATEVYDPNATEILAQIQIEIYKCEMSMNRPLAAHAALELAARYTPGNASIRQGIDTMFGKENRTFPASVAQLHTFKKLSTTASAERRAAWDAALTTAGTAKLSDAVKAFERLTQTADVEPAAWFNLGLCQAWLGNNAAALDALDRYVTSEPDDVEAAGAWALGEALRFGVGMEDKADYVQYTCVMVLQSGEAAMRTLAELDQIGLLANVQIDKEQGVIAATILEPAPPALTPELTAKQNAKPAVYFHLAGQMIRLWNSNREALEKMFAFFKESLGNTIAQAQVMRGPAEFLEPLSAGLRLPRHAASNEEVVARVHAGFESYFEEEWLHRPLKSLNGAKPSDALADGLLRKKLRGVLQYLQECAALVQNPYDFTRLTGKLGLSEAIAAPASPTGAPQAVGIDRMSAADLAGLAADSLSSGDLDLAYQTALKLEARESAAKFASHLVGRPPYAERMDRFPLYQLLINQATAQSNLDAALDYVNEGEADDCSNNEGKRRNEWELRRAQLHAKRSEFDQAKDVFDRLIARVPNEMSYRISAAETMLSGRQKDKALAYAQAGLAEAGKQKNRDLEGHFKELMSAAQK